MSRTGHLSAPATHLSTLRHGLAMRIRSARRVASARVGGVGTRAVPTPAAPGQSQLRARNRAAANGPSRAVDPARQFREDAFFDFRYRSQRVKLLTTPYAPYMVGPDPGGSPAAGRNGSARRCRRMAARADPVDQDHRCAENQIRTRSQVFGDGFRQSPTGSRLHAVAGRAVILLDLSPVPSAFFRRGRRSLEPAAASPSPTSRHQYRARSCVRSHPSSERKPCNGRAVPLEPK